MPNINTKKYRGFLAEHLAHTISTNPLYVGIGRVTPWEGDVIPTPTNDPQSVDFGYWRDSIAFKRLLPSGANLVVPRINWTYGVVYDQYDDQDASLFDKSFYVLDVAGAAYRVYKCLWNNDGRPSLTTPSTYAGESAFPVLSPTDGYVWQFLYSIDPADDFLTNDWMPVYTDDYTQSVAATFSGTLPTQVPLVIESPGAGYNAAEPFTITITGDGANAAIANTTLTVAQNGTLSNAMLSSGGTNYTHVDSITVDQTGATLAQLRAIIPPLPNHGYNPARELGASAVMLRTKFAQSEGGKLTTDNDYRRIFLVDSPLLANGAPATGTFYKQTYDLTIADLLGEFSADLSVTDVTVANTTYEVTATAVDVVTVGANTVLRVTNVNPQGRGFANTFLVGDVVQAANTPTVSASITAVDLPELQPYSGSVLYVEHHSPITRTADGEEEIKLVLNFG